MRHTKITLWVKCEDTEDASDWRNESKFHDRVRKGINGVTVLQSALSEFDPTEIVS